MSKKQQQEAATKPVSIHYGEDGKPDGVRICDNGEDFILALHDEFNGKDVRYAEAKKCDLPTHKMFLAYSHHINEIQEAMVKAGGEKLSSWYWLGTPAEEVFGAYYVSSQLIFYGANGSLYYYSRISSYRVRVARRLNTKVLKS